MAAGFLDICNHCPECDSAFLLDRAHIGCGLSESIEHERLRRTAVEECSAAVIDHRMLTITRVLSHLGHLCLRTAEQELARRICGKLVYYHLSEILSRQKGSAHLGGRNIGKAESRSAAVHTDGA